MLQILLENDEITSEELMRLLEARDDDSVEFLLIDVREDMEYNMGRIKGVDMLKPTSSFGEWANELLSEIEDKIVIFTCRSGNRSGQVRDIFAQNGHKRVINHKGGIISYYGSIEK